MKHFKRLFSNYFPFGALTFLFYMGHLLNAQAQGTLVVPPGHANSALENAGIAHLVKSTDYKVEVRRTGTSTYTTCYVYKTDNYASNVYDSETRLQSAASFTNFSFSGTSVDVRVIYITPSANASSVTVRPLNYGITPVRNGDTVTFTLASPKKISVEINNRLNPLFLFADAPDIVPAENEVTYFYGPGIHKIGLHKQLNTGEKVYIAGGAVIQGTFYIPTNSHDIEVRGRGIITNGDLPTAAQRRGVTQTANNGAPSIDSIQKYAVFTGRKNDFGTTIHYNLSFEGFIMTNTSGTHFAMVNSNHQNHDNTFRNLKEIDWSGNTDNVFDGDDNIVDDCFFFNNDDCTVTRGSNNLTITNLTYWGGDWGRLLWMRDYAASNGITYDNINLIGHDGEKCIVNLDAVEGNNVEMKNVSFKNVRVEEHPYRNGYSKNRFAIMESNAAKILNWTFENITVDDQNDDEGLFNATGTGTINVVFKNLKMDGNNINSTTAANFTVTNTNSSVTFQLNPEISLKEGNTAIADNGTYNFGSLTAGTNVTKTFTISNTGLATLNLTGTPKVTVTGTGFSRITDAAATVSAGGNTTFQLRFAPGATGAFTGTVSIANNDADENPYNFSISGTGTASANLIDNPNFNTTPNSSTDWGLALTGSAASTFGLVTRTGYSGNVLKTTITNAGSQSADIQVRQTLPVTAGNTYTITFKASADAGRTIGLMFQRNVSPWNIWLSQITVNLTTSVQTFGPFTFNCTTTDATNLIKFLCGGNSSAVYIDDVVVTVSSSPRMALTPAVETEVTTTTDSETKKLSVYPNPASGAFKIEVQATAGEQVYTRLTDMQGHILLAKQFITLTNGRNVFEIRPAPLPDGIYLVDVKTNKGLTRTIKLNIRH